MREMLIGSFVKVVCRETNGLPMRNGFTFDDVLLVPRKSGLQSRAEVSIRTWLTKSIPLATPFISANMDAVTESRMAIAMAQAGGIGIIHRFLSIERQIIEVRKVRQIPLKVGAAIGVRGDYLERAKALIAADVNVLVVDVAHGHAGIVLDAVSLLRSTYPTMPIIAGNVATAEGTKDLIACGASAVKVGIGPGSSCTTRVVTGTGVPQLSAIMECAEAANGIPIIADGGIRSSGDVVKALAAGASTVMLGNLLAGTEESPGSIILRNGQQYKTYRGMASLWATARRQSLDAPMEDDELSQVIAEGVEALVPYRGKVADVLHQLAGGLRSGMFYCGARTIKELQQNAEFIRITAASIKEGLPHDIQIV